MLAGCGCRTVLDKYIMGCFFFTYCCILENIAVAQVSTSPRCFSVVRLPVVTFSSLLFSFVPMCPRHTSQLFLSDSRLAYSSTLLGFRTHSQFTVYYSSSWVCASPTYTCSLPMIYLATGRRQLSWITGACGSWLQVGLCFTPSLLCALTNKQ